MLEIVADVFVVGEKASGCILDKVATFGYGKRDDGAIRGTQLFQDSLSRFRGIKVAGERSNDAIALLLGIHEQESVEKVLLNQCRVNQFVRWEQADSELAPRL